MMFEGLHWKILTTVAYILNGDSPLYALVIFYFFLNLLNVHMEMVLQKLNP